MSDFGAEDDPTRSDGEERALGLRMRTGSN